jgi:hypothetical protein
MPILLSLSLPTSCKQTGQYSPSISGKCWCFTSCSDRAEQVSEELRKATLINLPLENIAGLNWQKLWKATQLIALSQKVFKGSITDFLCRRLFLKASAVCDLYCRIKLLDDKAVDALSTLKIKKDRAEQVSEELRKATRYLLSSILFYFKCTQSINSFVVQ